MIFWQTNVNLPMNSDIYGHYALDQLLLPSLLPLAPLFKVVFKPLKHFQATIK
jgi:hypothetical protein